MAITYADYVPDNTTLTTLVTEKIDDIVSKINTMASYCYEDTTTNIVRVNITSTTAFNEVLRAVIKEFKFFKELNGYSSLSDLKEAIATELEDNNIKSYIIDKIAVY